MKKNQKKGLAISTVAISLVVTSLALYAWQKKDVHRLEWTKTESGKPDSVMVVTIIGDTSLVGDTMKLLKVGQKEVIVPIDDTAKSEVILIKR